MLSALWTLDGGIFNCGTIALMSKPRAVAASPANRQAAMLKVLYWGW